MEEVLLRFPHTIGMKIIEELNNSNLRKCRELDRLWKSFIDDEKILLVREFKKFLNPAKSFKKALRSSSVKDENDMIETLKKLEEMWKSSKSPFYEAAVKGEIEIFKMLFDDSEVKHLQEAKH